MGRAHPVVCGATGPGRVYSIGCATALVGVFMVWTAHPVYMVVSLVAVSLGLGALVVGSGAQFVGLVVVLVYVGAVNVLFLFVIMMINLRVQLFPLVVEQSVYSFVGVATTTAAAAALVGPSVGTLGVPTPGYHPAGATGLAELGGYMFGTHHVLANLIVSGVLFVAMVGAICLTMVATENYRTQSFFAQTTRPAAVFAFRHVG